MRIDDPIESTSSVKSSKVATNGYWSLLNSSKGHFCGNVRRYVVNSAVIQCCYIAAIFVGEVDDGVGTTVEVGLE